jgi:hypothetical protein
MYDREILTAAGRLRGRGTVAVWLVFLTVLAGIGGGVSVPAAAAATGPGPSVAPGAFESARQATTDGPSPAGEPNGTGTTGGLDEPVTPAFDPIVPPPSLPELPLLTCGVITESGRQAVGTFTAGTDGACIEVAADDVLLVGYTDDSTLTGDGDGVAVSLAPGHENVTVRGLTIEGWLTGIDAEYANASAEPYELKSVVTVDDVRIRNVSTGIAVGEVAGTDTRTAARIRNVTVSNASPAGVTVGGIDRVSVTDVAVDTVSATSGFLGVTPGTGLVLAGEFEETAGAELSNVSVSRADRGVVLFSTGSFQVADLRLRDVDDAIVSERDASGVSFRDVALDGARVRGDLSLSYAVLSPPTVPPTPATPGGARSLMDGVRLSGTGGGAAAVRLHYDTTVADQFEATVTGNRYDDGVGSWRSGGRIHPGNKTVRFVPDGTDRPYGVFYTHSTLTECGEVDASGVYTVGRVTGGSDPCLFIRSDDVHLVAAGPGAGVYGNGRVGVGQYVLGDLRRLNTGTNVSIRGLTVDGYDTGVAVDLPYPDGGVHLRDVTVRNASAAGVEIDRAGSVVVETLTVENGGRIGVVVRSGESVSVTDLLVDGLTGDPVGTTPTARVGSGTALVLGATPETTVTGLRVANATEAVTVVGPAAGSVLLVADPSSVDHLLVAPPGSEVSNLTVGTPIPTTAAPNGPATRVRFTVTDGAVSAVPAPATAPVDRPVRLGAVSLTGLGGTGESTVVFPVDPTAVDRTNVSVYRVLPGGGWGQTGGVVAGDELAAVVTAGDGTTETFGAFGAPVASEAPPGGNSSDGADPGPGPGPGPGQPTDCPAVGASGQTADLDGDGRCEDVDGDGRFTFIDVIDLVFVDPGRLALADVTGLDFDGDGRFSFTDVIDLVFRL